MVLRWRCAHERENCGLVVAAVRSNGTRGFSMGDHGKLPPEVPDDHPDFSSKGIAPDPGASGDPGVEVFEIAGAIKWFDVSKGYGFIVPDNGLADVLLHVTCLRAGGYQTAY